MLFYLKQRFQITQMEVIFQSCFQGSYSRLNTLDRLFIIHSVARQIGGSKCGLGFMKSLY